MESTYAKQRDAIRLHTTKDVEGPLCNPITRPKCNKISSIHGDNIFKFIFTGSCATTEENDTNCGLIEAEVPKVTSIVEDEVLKSTKVPVLPPFTKQCAPTCNDSTYPPTIENKAVNSAI